MRAFTIKVWKDDNTADWRATSPAVAELHDGLKQWYPNVNVEVVDVVTAEQHSALRQKMDDILARVERYCTDPEKDDDFVADMIRFGMPDPFHRHYAVDMNVSFRVRFNLSDVSTELDVADIESAICEQVGLVLRKDVDNITMLDVRYRIEDFDVDDGSDDWEIEIAEV